VAVEKKEAFRSEAARLLSDMRGFLGVAADSLRIFNVYDVERFGEDADAAQLESAFYTVFSEPVTDNIWPHGLPALDPDTRILCWEALPGQFDQRADSCAQCLQLLWGGERPLVRYIRAAAFTGIDEGGLDRLREHLINPVDSRETTLEMPETLRAVFDPPAATPVCAGFRELDGAGLDGFIREHALAMDRADAQCLRDYMRLENRDPTLAEVRVVDTYWSDHCRHTTFLTRLTDIEAEDSRAAESLALYREHMPDGAVTLMRIATAGMKALKRAGKLPNLDESDEVNACTVKVKLKLAGGGQEDWLLLFKNETHNHPTEIEPFGGAATCIGGAIRDPLSGRAFVYQAMRVTGAADPRALLKDTIPGKLPQRVLTVTAANGYSSYGNQIGLATGHVTEIYHPGYAAKRMEIGAVVGAAPARNVVREQPLPGDAVILVGGRTGRDGIGGATGSSMTHNKQSVTECAAQVQKGNAPEERKLQRLFLDPQVTKVVKRCNDFGAGGVAVAVGELADGLCIQLDSVPKKYEGLGGAELAISESQERMAVVVRREDVDFFIGKAAGENLEATVIAEITQEKRMRMVAGGETIVDLSREFLNSNGAEKTARAVIPKAQAPAPRAWEKAATLAEGWLLLASDLNYCSQKGLVERFDGSVGASSVLMPHGGSEMLTPAQSMAALLPADGAETASVMSFGFDPQISQSDPFGGAVYAVVTSVAKLAACGVSPDTAYLTFQEYFPRPGSDPLRWGLPAAALLGAFHAQMGLGVASIGGKDSMSGSFENMDVPPTLVSFAVGTADAQDIISPEFKAAGNPVYLFSVPAKENGLPDYPALREMWTNFSALARKGFIKSAWAIETGGVSGGIIKMALGNNVGFAFDDGFSGFFDAPWGGILAECSGRGVPGGSETDGDVSGGRQNAAPTGAVLVGYTQEKAELTQRNARAPLASLLVAWTAPLEDVFPTRPADADTASVPVIASAKAPAVFRGAGMPKPLAVITAFPGTNSELDTARAVRNAGGAADVAVIRNLKPEWIDESVNLLCEKISAAQMLIIPGGFSAGDEPDGSAKYIVSFFRNPRVSEATRALLARGGLILGICNGFQALIKLGLVPFGDIRTPDESSPTLTFNNIGRHQSRYVFTRVASTLSPWLSKCALNKVYAPPISHGEGRFAASPQTLRSLAETGQIAQQYCDAFGVPSMDIRHNPNGSDWAVEAISSPDGRVLGKMAHNERTGPNVAINIAGDKLQPIFEGGVGYFSL
jgi:phosphoribosylformylglycinamidine synthase